MIKFALLMIFPCLIVADTQCNGGEISCPEDKICCTVDGKSACCDPEGQLPERPLFMTAPDPTIQNSTYGDCLFYCQGTCCGSGIYTTCCPVKMGNCCSADRCCEFGNTCCATGCCGMFTKCCGSWCCKSSQRCGLSYRTCFNAAAGLHPTTLVTLIAVLVAAYAVTKM